MYGNSIQRDSIVITEIHDQDFIDNQVNELIGKIAERMWKEHRVKLKDETYRCLFILGQQFSKNINDTIVSSIPREPDVPPYNAATY